MSCETEKFLPTVDDTVNRVYELIHNYDFESFLIGVRLPEDCDSVARDQIKKALAVKIGEKLSNRLGRDVDFSRPDITVILDYRDTSAEPKPKIILDLRSLFIYGEYQKLSRNIPQTKWICPKCHGKGCPYCNFMGKLYPTSVEEEIGRVLLDLTGGRDTKFHGAGREDRDALMLGWRPFVIEIRDPIVRHIDLEEATRLINNKSSSVKVRNLEFVDRSKVVELKSAKYDKTYEAIIMCDQSYPVDKLNDLENVFVNHTIKQRTPKRVAHRRSDLIRERKIYSIKCEPIDNRTFRAVIHAESGAYIKELVSGDDGRTDPSFSSILGVSCRVVELNVLEVHTK